ncbi:MAG: hypothetical protein Kow00121_44110 [Elainellaceae cyanobacterium]
MNPDTLIQFAQKGLRVTVGATASLIETLQDPQRRDESFARLQTEFSHLAEEWELKGEFTEQEARTFVDSLLKQRFESNYPSEPPATTPPTSTPAATAPNIQQDLQELTTQLAAIRAELEKLRENS